MTSVRPALIARLYRAIEENRMSDAVLLLSQVFSYYGRSRQTRDVVFMSELRRLGDEYCQSGDPLLAEEHYKLALALYEAFFTEQHEEALSTMRRLCDLLSTQKRNEELDRMLEWAYVIVQRIEAKHEGKAAPPLEAINWQTAFDTKSELIVNGRAARSSLSSATRVRVLLVEDNPDDAEYVSEQLAAAPDLPVEIDRACELREGIVKVTRGDVDIILLDLGLPDSNALDTFYRMTASAPTVPIIILTGQDDRNLAVKAIKRGAHDYLIKGRDEPAIVLRSIVDALQRTRNREVERLTQSAAARAIEESIENSPLGLMFMDARAVVRNVNERWCEIAGGQRSEYAGKNFFDIFPWISTEHVTRLLEGGTLQILDIAVEDRLLSLNGWAVRSPGNGVIGALISTACSSKQCVQQVTRAQRFS